MNPELIITALGLAIVDSINPSALVMTVVLLAATGGARGPLVYVAGIFITYLAIGIGVLLGVGTGARGALERLLEPSRPLYAAELAVAVAAGAWSVRALRRGREPRAPAPPPRATPARLLLLGATVTAIESTTAVPYLAALALLVRADAPVPAGLVVLGAYNALFVLPPLALIALWSWRGDRLRAIADRLRRPARGGSKRLGPALVAAGALALGSDAVLGLAAGRGWI